MFRSLTTTCTIAAILFGTVVEATSPALAAPTDEPVGSQDPLVFQMSPASFEGDRPGSPRPSSPFPMAPPPRQRPPHRQRRPPRRARRLPHRGTEDDHHPIGTDRSGGRHDVRGRRHLAAQFDSVVVSTDRFDYESILLRPGIGLGGPVATL